MTKRRPVFVFWFVEKTFGSHSWSLLGRRSLADPQRGVEGFVAAAQLEHDSIAGLLAGDQGEHRLRILDRLPGDRKEDVARADAAGIRRAAALDAGDQGARRVRQAERFGELGRDFLASTPIQPRVTAPLRMICSMTFLAVATGMANPMPSEPPERE